MAPVRLMLFRETLRDNFCILKRHLCRHKPLLTGVVDWANGCLDVQTRHQIERHWQAQVTNYQFDRNDPKNKMYILAMFPYPSGSLHMGHVRVYTISDTMARYYRLKGKNVLHPMGWDSFGLPAENAARERRVEPKKWTELNISHMRKQLEELGFSFDWNHEVSTCDPRYYHWTQWLFLKLYQAGLVYKKESFVNWDPVDKTVLADEQVDVNNCSWRSGAQVEKKLLRQWFIRSSLFCESLQNGLQNLRKDDWQDIIKVQSNWIGKVNGTTADCKLVSSDIADGLSLTIWLRRPEQFRHASFVAVSEGSMLDLLETSPPVETVSTVAEDGSPAAFTIRRLATTLRHPLTGKTLPIFVVKGFLNFDFNAETYVGAPGFFEKDRRFLELISAEGVGVEKADLKEDDREAVCEELRHLGIGGHPSSSSARDWLVSRQRFWGTPIPMINCDTCNDAVPVPFEELPVTLPSANPGDVADSQGKSPLFQDKAWLHTKCPKCGGDATRETDTMDTFVDSSWYYLRFLDPHNAEAPVKPELAQQLMPVDLYVGGKEHANLHLYYARFVSHFLHSEGLLPQKEPFRRLLPQGMVMGRCYSDPNTGRFLTHEEIDFAGPHPIHRQSGEKAVVSWEKMSKSKHNGVSPAHVVQDYGVDTTRLIMLADAIPQSQKNWSPETSGGVYRWQNRMFGLVAKLRSLRSAQGRNEQALSADRFASEEKSVWESRNKCVSTVTFNYEETMQFSVAVTSMQGFSKALQKASPEIVAQSIEFERGLASLLILVAPMAPHFASELWQGIASAPFVLTNGMPDFDWTQNILEQPWPQVDMDYELDLIVEVNGCQVAVIKVPRRILDNLEAAQVQELAVNADDVRHIIGDESVKSASVRTWPGYRRKVNLTVPHVTVSEDQMIVATKAGLKAQRRAKKQRQKL